VKARIIYSGGFESQFLSKVDLDALGKIPTSWVPCGDTWLERMKIPNRMSLINLIRLRFLEENESATFIRRTELGDKFLSERLQCNLQKPPMTGSNSPPSREPDSPASPDGPPTGISSRGFPTLLPSPYSRTKKRVGS
jgi:hypothetical protein